MPQRLTRPTRRVLEAFLDEPRREWYGLELIDATKLSSGTTYPILHRLESDGWLQSTVENIDPTAEGRPARRLYQLTGVGETAARQTLAARKDTRRGTRSLVPRAGGAA